MAEVSPLSPNQKTINHQHIFGLPYTEENSRLVIFPVPWEVTVSSGSNTARGGRILKASQNVSLFDPDSPNGVKNGFYMEEVEKSMLMKSDYLRREAELYINFISQEENADLSQNKFMKKSLKEINAGSRMMIEWVYEHTKSLLAQDKLVGLLGGDHSTPLGYYKALGEKYGKFGILQIDAHCDLKKEYEGFLYSYASIMYNALEEVKEIEKVVQAGIRDYSEEEWNYICQSNYRIITYLDQQIKERMFTGETWNSIAEEIIKHLPYQVYISFDVAGL